MIKILLTRKWPESVVQSLQSRYAVTCHNAPLTKMEWQDALESFDAICPCVTDQVTADLFAGIKIKTRILANYGVGYNHIDLVATTAHGLSVTNTPDVLTDATADLAMTLLLMLGRRAGEGERQVRSGLWSGWYPTHMMGTMITGASLGIIGMGRIGQAMASKAHYGFGMKILYHNKNLIKQESVVGVRAEYCADLANLLGRADFVSIHCPGNANTRHLINAQRLAQMQPHAFLINTSRGDVVDEVALIQALQAGRIAGAGLDVFEHEPAVPAALKQLESVVLLPHLGSATLQSREAMGMRVMQNLEAFFSGKKLPDLVL